MPCFSFHVRVTAYVIRKAKARRVPKSRKRFIFQTKKLIGQIHKTWTLFLSLFYRSCDVCLVCHNKGKRRNGKRRRTREKSESKWWKSLNGNRVVPCCLCFFAYTAPIHYCWCCCCCTQWHGWVGFVASPHLDVKNETGKKDKITRRSRSLSLLQTVFGLSAIALLPELL